MFRNLWYIVTETDILLFLAVPLTIATCMCALSNFKITVSTAQQSYQYPLDLLYFWTLGGSLRTVFCILHINIQYMYVSCLFCLLLWMAALKNQGHLLWILEDPNQSSDFHLLCCYHTWQYLYLYLSKCVAGSKIGVNATEESRICSGFGCEH